MSKGLEMCDFSLEQLKQTRKKNPPILPAAVSHDQDFAGAG